MVDVYFGGNLAVIYNLRTRVTYERFSHLITEVAPEVFDKWIDKTKATKEIPK